MPPERRYGAGGEIGAKKMLVAPVHVQHPDIRYMPQTAMANCAAALPNVQAVCILVYPTGYMHAVAPTQRSMSQGRV